MSDHTFEPAHPGDRLLAIVSRLPGTGETMLIAWARALGIDPSPAKTLEVFRKIVLLQSVIDEVEAGLRAAKGIQPQRFLDTLQDLRRLCAAANNHENSHSHAAVITRVITGLEFLCTFRSLPFPAEERVLPASDLQKAKNDFDALVEALSAAADLDITLKSVLLQIAELGRRALADYELFGLQRIREAYAAMLVRFFTSPAVERAQEDPKTKPVVDRVKKSFGILDGLARFGANATKLLEGVSKLLED